MTAEQEQLIARIRATWPEELLRMLNWTQWFKVAKPKPGFSGKVPCSGVNRPDTWFTFEDALTKSWEKIGEGENKKWEREEDSPLRPGRGLGFQFFGTDLLPIDLDHIRCVKTGTWCSEAKFLVSKLKTFTEWSVSGTGLHCIGRGKIRQELVESVHIQFWNPARGQKRFFTATGEMLGDDFTTIRDCGEEFQMYASHPRMFSVKMQEELVKLDPEQAASMPPEPAAPLEEIPKERSRTKIRKVHPDFDIYDYLTFNKLKTINTEQNELGTCIRISTCPNKGGAHASHNETTANFIYPTADGGLGYHCHSSGCDNGKFPIAAAIAALEKVNGKYPKLIYKDDKPAPRKLFLIRKTMTEIEYKSPKWVKRHVLMADALNMFVGLPDVGKSLMECCHMAELSRQGKKTLLICREDAYDSVWKPRLIVARANLDLIIPVLHVLAEDGEKIPWMLNDLRHLELFREALLEEKADLGVIDPIADFMGTLDLNKATDVRRITGLLNPIAQETHTALLTSAHTTKAVVDSVIKVASGSIQLMAAVPCAWYLVKDPDNPAQRLMLQARNKHGKKRGFKYIVEGKEWPAECPLDDPADGEDGVGCVVIKGEETRTADELLERNSDKDNGAKTRIRRWLTEMLANGPVDTQQAGAEMNARGFNLSTVKDVCREMGVVRDGKHWNPPKKKPQPVQEEFDLTQQKEN